MSRVSKIVTGAAVLLLVGTAAAFALWTTAGSGTGGASTGTMQPVTLSTGTVSGTALYPGLTADGTSTGGTLTVTASNPNPFPVTVTVTVASPATGCTTPSVSIPSSVVASFPLPAHASEVTTSLARVLSMGTDASNDCQGKTLTVPLSWTAQAG